jgi:hypothetical protein
VLPVQRSRSQPRVPAAGIEVDGLVKRCGDVLALGGISFEVPAGQP